MVVSFVLGGQIQLSCNTSVVIREQSKWLLEKHD